MNNLVIAKHNVCPSVKQYKMEPIKRPKDAPVIKRPAPVPTLGPVDPFVHYRILELKENGVAVICSDVTKLVNGELTVQEVNISKLGKNTVHAGDIIGFKSSDVTLSKPFITHRASQQHQHPEHLVASHEKIRI